ncbi:MAG TPA: RIP metalloprotease RseP [candidate division Zixibacteria bacterium]|nr:RIP metalloprotease RseP [candidate division Zixibacteria bacterium]
MATIFVLGLLVFVHELGHFLAAKRAGVRVERFSLGFPPKLIGKKIGETEYMISWLPLGGYVKLAGESLEEEESNQPYSLQAKPAWVKAIIFAAGPLMNFITAFVLLWGVFYVSGDVETDKSKIVIGTVAPGSPAEQAGIKPGDVILSLNGERIGRFDSLAEKVYSMPGAPVEVVWASGNDTIQKTLVTMKEESYNEKGDKIFIGRIGIQQAFTRKPVGFLTAGERAGITTVAFTGQVVRFVKGLFTREFSLKSVGGPVFISKIAGQEASRGFSSLLFFTALLSVNLALLNLFPIPALDGGHLLFLAIEGVIRRPISLKVRALVTQVGFGLLLLLIVFVTYNDVMRLFQ